MNHPTHSSHDNFGDDTEFLNSSDASSGQEPPIRLFNEGEAPDIPEKLLQDRQPKVGDLISYFDAASGNWLEAHIITDLNRRWRCYYNIMHADGRKDGLYLLPNTRWTFLHWNSEEDIEHTREKTINFPSLDPTASSPSMRPRSHTYCAHTSSNNAVLSNTLDLEDLNITRTESMEWDFTGTELISTVPVPPQTPGEVHLNEVCNLTNVLPLSLNLRCNLNDVPLDAVLHLDHRLPLSSSPTHRDSRSSRHRRLIPRERTPPRRRRIRTYFRRFNPFRKKI